jgi:hypothetical protein
LNDFIFGSSALLRCRDAKQYTFSADGAEVESYAESQNLLSKAPVINGGHGDGGKAWGRKVEWNPPRSSVGKRSVNIAA